MLSRHLRGKNAHNCLHRSLLCLAVKRPAWCTNVGRAVVLALRHELAHPSLCCSSMLQQLLCQTEKLSSKRDARKGARAFCPFPLAEEGWDGGGDMGHHITAVSPCWVNRFSGPASTPAPISASRVLLPPLLPCRPGCRHQPRGAPNGR